MQSASCRRYAALAEEEPCGLIDMRYDRRHNPLAVLRCRGNRCLSFVGLVAIMIT
jgi:hypothetical protein